MRAEARGAGLEGEDRTSEPGSQVLFAAARDGDRPEMGGHRILNGFEEDLNRSTDPKRAII